MKVEWRSGIWGLTAWAFLVSKPGGGVAMLGEEWPCVIVLIMALPRANRRLARRGERTREFMIILSRRGLSVYLDLWLCVGKMLFKKKGGETDEDAESREQEKESLPGFL
jgi:hypothetical protein